MQVLDRHRVSGRSYLKKKAFFEAVASRAGYLPPETIEKVYRALIQTTVQELRRTGLVRWPDFGDFTLRMMRARRLKRLVSRGRSEIGFVGERRIMRFDSDYKLKGYFRMLDTGIIKK